MPGAGDPQALNRYSYVVNNPLRYTDPSGHVFDMVCDFSPQHIGCGGASTSDTASPCSQCGTEVLGPPAPPGLYEDIEASSWGNEVEAAFCWGFGAGYGIQCGPSNVSSIGPAIALSGMSDLGIPLYFNATAAEQAAAAASRTARSVTLSPSLTARLAEESPAAIVSRTAQAQAAKGVDALKGSLKPAELTVFESNAAVRGRFLGQAAHRATAQALNEQYPGRFEYHTRGADFYDTWTGQRIELTTPGQVASHLMRPYAGGGSIATYTLPK